MQYNHNKLFKHKNWHIVTYYKHGKTSNDYVNVNQKHSHAVDSICIECPEEKKFHKDKKEISNQRGLWEKWIHDDWLDQVNENPDYIVCSVKSYEVSSMWSAGILYLYCGHTFFLCFVLSAHFFTHTNRLIKQIICEWLS